MSLGYLVLLAVVQGITEFLPISSSAHLILLPHLVGAPDQGLVFDVAANTGTFLAVLVYFRREALTLTVAALGRDPARRDDRRLAWQVAAASLPVLLCGLLFRDLVATLGRDPRVVATSSIVFGILLGVADRLGRRQRSMRDLRAGDALAVGLAQALSLVPGTSRSGVTMTAAIARNLRRDEAARFAFLLALPVGAAAALWEGLGFVRAGPSSDQVGQVLVVVVVSALVGLAVIHFLLGYLRRRGMLAFALYRVALGITIFAVLGLR